MWGELENALLDSAKADRQRVSVFAWKLIAYPTDAQVKACASVLRQNLDGLERIAPEDFAV